MPTPGDRISRLLRAYVAPVVFIIIPVFIMTYVVETKHRLIVIGISVFLFSTCLELDPKVENKDVLTATAGYAATLIVYVGSVSGQ